MPENEETTSANPPLLKILKPFDVAAIDEALGQIGLYGEVHLVVENGRLRFIRTVRSEAVAGAPSIKSGRQK
ncbi:MAG TPA: hypothetical protein VF932_06960 [Anaerolineae bacterium]